MIKIYVDNEIVISNIIINLKNSNVPHIGSKYLPININIKQFITNVIILILRKPAVKICINAVGDDNKNSAVIANVYCKFGNMN